MTDYERGVEQASAVYKEVIREYVAENNEIRERARKQAIELEALRSGCSVPEAEEYRLREYITRLEQANIVLDSDNCDLRNDMKDMQFFIAENRKLRELVRDMWHEGAFEPGACYEKAAERLEERTRELGIEVD